MQKDEIVGIIGLLIIIGIIAIFWTPILVIAGSLAGYLALQWYLGTIKVKIEATRDEYLFFCGFLPLLLVALGFLAGNWLIGLMLSFFPPMVLYLKSKKVND